MSVRAAVLPLLHLGAAKPDLFAFYECACRSCGENLKAALLPGNACIPPPRIRSCHQCAQPPVEFELIYVGSGKDHPS